MFGFTSNRRLSRDITAGAFALTFLTAGVATAQIRTSAGALEGLPADEAGVRAYLGIPYAAPPIGALRWQAPRPVAPWQGVRKATAFGARCVQARIFDDMVFRDEPSEDCLHLNVWTPAVPGMSGLPVMVWIHGGGFQAGSGSEPRQDGARLARKGVVVVTFNYRLGVFGFLAHPELTKASGRASSGNYGLMDQVAALQWVKDNIKAFGGDPRSVTIFGESAGSFAVSSLMASPLAKGLFQRAIGESGAFFNAPGGLLAPRTLAEAEQLGATFAESVGAASLAALRDKPAEELLAAAMRGDGFRFSPTVDGHVIPRAVPVIYAEARQARVPLLAGWNADEVRKGVVLAKPTAESFTADVRKRFGDQADAILRVYPASTDAEALESAAALASDGFIGYSTWKWIETHARTGSSPVFRYSFDRKIPVPPGTAVNGTPVTSADVGARHAGEIEYVFGTLDSSPQVPWDAADRKLSDQMMTYWANFARSGDPNGPAVPAWPRYDGAANSPVLHLDTEVHSAPDANRARYEVLDALATQHGPSSRRGQRRDQ
jgi:para-nitrobenzyl esterase